MHSKAVVIAAVVMAAPLHAGNNVNGIACKMCRRITGCAHLQSDDARPPQQPRRVMCQQVRSAPCTSPTRRSAHTVHVSFGKVACPACTWVPRATARIAAPSQSRAAAHLTASALRPKRTFFWSALFTRLAVPMYSQEIPSDGPLVLGPRPDPDPASTTCAGAMFVTSFRATCACYRELEHQGIVHR